MSTIARHDPLQYLAQELDAMKSQGIYRRLRILEDEQKAHTNFDHRSVVNLSSNNYLGSDDASEAEAAGARRDRTVRRGIGIGPHDRRNDGDPHGARATARGVQADRGRGGLSERIRGERRHRLVDAVEGRRRSSPTSSITRASSTAAGSVAPRSRCFRTRMSMPCVASCRTCRRDRGSCSSPTVCSAWTAISVRCRRSARSPRNTAAS